MLFISRRALFRLQVIMVWSCQHYGAVLSSLWVEVSSRDRSGVGLPGECRSVNSRAGDTQTHRALQYVLHHFCICSWDHYTFVADCSQTVFTYGLIQWRTQNFRMGGVEVPQAPRVVGRGATGGRVWGGGCASAENFSYFLLKIPHFDAFWYVYFLNRMPMGGF